MTSMEQTRKVCIRGHEMEPAWEVCPYCPSPASTGSPGEGTGGNPALARTVRMDATEVRAAAPPAAAAPPPARKTEIMERPPQIEGTAWLVGATGSDRGRMHRIDRARCVAGASSGCEIVLTGDHVSDQHASFRFMDRRFVLTDLDSTNGTRVNGKTVHQHDLNDGDRVSLGGGDWIFKCVVFEDA